MIRTVRLGPCSYVTIDKSAKIRQSYALSVDELERDFGILALRDVKTENTRNAVLVGLHPPFRRARPLNRRTGSAILKPLVREHRAHTAFMSTGHPAMHEVQYLGIGVAVVTRP